MFHKFFDFVGENDIHNLVQVVIWNNMYYNSE